MIKTLLYRWVLCPIFGHKDLWPKELNGYDNEFGIGWFCFRCQRLVKRLGR